MSATKGAGAKPGTPLAGPAPILSAPERAIKRDKWGHRICEHGRKRNRCKDCGGSQICEHGRRRHLCKDCDGASICEHGRRRACCKDCVGSQICEHGRRRHRCKDCDGASICEHGRQRSQCPICRPIGAVKTYKRSAKRRGYSWSLTDEQAIYLLSQPCAYCGTAPSGGIDRHKNAYGYTASNSLPCCSDCNYGKKSRTATQFIGGCHKVSKHCVDRETFMARNAELQKQLKEFEQWQSESTPVDPAESSEK